MKYLEYNFVKIADFAEILEDIKTLFLRLY